jgi:endonuclease YncB( thermonuclease family)
MRITQLVLALTLVLAAAPAIPAQMRTINGKVVAIADGDTLTVLDGRLMQHKIRLAGIDAPEKGQPFGTKAREALASKAFGKDVLVALYDNDRHGRDVGRIHFDHRDINMELVQEGFAWRYPQYDKVGRYTDAEADARDHKRGLWADPHPIPPWEYRRAKRGAE